MNMKVERVNKIRESHDKPSAIKRITLLEADGSETVINITEDLHFIFGFTKVSKGGGDNVPMEIMVKGDSSVVGELFYQMGENHEGLVKYCIRRAIEEKAKEVSEQIKKSGVDPVAEALKKMPTPEGTTWN